MPFAAIIRFSRHLRRRHDGRTLTDRTPLISGPIITPDLSSGTTLDDSSRSLAKQCHDIGTGFQFMSDLHLESTLGGNLLYAPYDIPKVAPHLILAGDICRFKDETGLHNLLRDQCWKYDKVIYIPGNHEYYGGLREGGLELANQLLKGTGDWREKLCILDRGQVDLGDTIVLGCTLHSHIPDDVEALTNDFERIRNWTVANHNAEHVKDVAWLKATLRKIASTKSDCRVIIVTHYAPAFEGTSHPKYRDSKHRFCFVSDTLQDLRECEGIEQVTHWVFGHTHYNAHFYYDDILVVSNQPHDRDCARKFDLEATI